MGVEVRRESPQESAPPVPIGIVDQGVGKVQERDADCSKGTTEVACEQDSESRSMWNQGAECCAEVPSRENNTQGTGPPFKGCFGSCTKCEQDARFDELKFGIAQRVCSGLELDGLACDCRRSL